MSHSFKWCLEKTRLAIYGKQVFCINRYGNRRWYLNGQLHRENGPAAEFTSGYRGWYLNGVYYPESDYWKEMKK